MIQNILTWAYVFLGIAAFVFWISAILAFFSMLKKREPGKSLFLVSTTGMFKDENFTEEGIYQRKKLFESTYKFFGAIAAMAFVVFLGIQTQ